MNFLCPACKTPLPVATPVVVACSQCGVEVDLTRVDTAPGQAKLWPEVDLTGESLGTFKLVSRAGSGGMGTVYVADGLTGRCAVKVLSPQLAADPSLRERFRREAQALRKVQHPGVVHIIDEGAQNGFCWYAMEHVEGKDLRARLAEGPLPLPEVEALARQLLDALAAVHEAQLVHRDLKPGNILLSPAGARLCDFGIARFDGATTLTESAALLGSLRYMAPEQRAGITTPKSDLYSLGLVLFEAATGGLPGEKDEPSGRVGKLIEALLQASPQKRPVDARAAAKMVAVKPKRPVGTAVAVASATLGVAIFATWAVLAMQLEPKTTAMTKDATVSPLTPIAPPVAVAAPAPDAGAPAEPERIARVRGGAIEISGFDPDAIGVLTRARRRELETCYETVLEGLPNVAGTVAVNVRVFGAAGVKGRGVPLLRPTIIRGVPQPDSDAPDSKAVEKPFPSKKGKAPPQPLERGRDPSVVLADSTTFSPELDFCVLNAVKGWPLPSPLSFSKGGTLRFRWSFDRATREEMAAEPPVEVAPAKPTPPLAPDTSLATIRGTGPKKPTKMMKGPSKAIEPLERTDYVAGVKQRLSTLTSKGGSKGALTDVQAQRKMVEVIDDALRDLGTPADDYDRDQQSELVSMRKKLAPTADGK